MSPAQSNNPQPLTALGDKVVELQGQVSEVQDAQAQAALYQELTRKLKELQAAFDAPQLTLDQLREARLKARTAAGIEQDYPVAGIKDELSRVDAATQAANHLPQKLLQAARDGARFVDVMYLNDDGAHRKGIFGIHRAPRGLEDLHSPAYRKLWNHLVNQGYEPYVRKEVEVYPECSINMFYLSVRLPD